MIFLVIDGTRLRQMILNLFKKTLKWKDVSALTVRHRWLYKESYKHRWSNKSFTSPNILFMFQYEPFILRTTASLIASFKIYRFLFVFFIALSSVPYCGDVYCKEAISWGSLKKALTFSSKKKRKLKKKPFWIRQRRSSI